MIIRTATIQDAEAILSIYTPYILDTAITFEYTVPPIEEFRERIIETLKKYPYLVAEENGEIIGYAYAGTFKARAAYSRCVETSIYIKQGQQVKGVGSVLYEKLEDRLRKQGILNVNACITWINTPNQYLTHQSPEFHTRKGYEKCAHFHKCGYKFGMWFDMIWMEKILGEHV